MAFSITRVNASGMGNELPISGGTLDANAPNKFYYTVKLIAGHGGLPIPYFSTTGRLPQDGPMDIRIMPGPAGAVLVEMTLDPSGYDCQFLERDSITLAARVDPSLANRYYGLTASAVSGKLLKLQFNTTYNDNSDPNVPNSKKANYDPFNLYLSFAMAGAVPRTVLRYDPDIKNPGDYG